MPAQPFKRLHIVGRKNHGKTTLLVDLIPSLQQLGLRIGTIKHTHHRHELDTPGKDSYRHRIAGSAVVGIASPRLNAVFWPPDVEPSATGPTADAQTSNPDRYAAFEPLMADCDLVLVEGDSHANATKVEVWRAALGDPPLATDDSTIVALVTDDAVSHTRANANCRLFARKHLRSFVTWIVNELQQERS